LERDLGFDLLQRIGKGVALTPRGQRYAADVRKALTVLGDAGTQNSGAGVGGSFAISCPPGFASMFLCSHIGEFQQMYRDVALSILTPRRLDDVSNPEADAFIAFGVGNWPNRAVELLCEVSFTPLCSPTLLNKVGGFSKPADVLRANLLHLGDTEDWARWLALSKVENPDTEGGIFFSDMNLVFSAAVAGQGIAMGDELTGRRALSEGRLVKPFEASVPSPRSYFLVFEHAKASHPVLNAFSDWLRAKLSENRLATY
jgi:LysR family glycine cleavage system transcriptional activator